MSTLVYFYIKDGVTTYGTTALVIPAFTPDADAFRFYDDGTESGSVAKAAQDTNINLDSTGDPQVHLRYRVQEIGGLSGLSTDDWRLQRSKNGGTFFNVTGGGDDVLIDSASSLTEGAATTNRASEGISDGTGSFVVGEQKETNSLISNHQITANNFTEHVFALKVIDADLTAGDEIDFRMTLNGGTPGMANSVTPRITIVAAVAIPPNSLALMGVGV